MDVRRYKLASALKVPWALGVQCFPLTPDQRSAAELAAAGRGPFVRLAERLSAGCTPHRPAAAYLALEPRDIMALGLALARAQRWAAAPVGKLKEWLRRSVNDFAPVMEDGGRAWLCRRISDYYGRPAVELTEAQVTWYLLLRGAFEEFHVSERRRSMTLRTLRQDAAMRHRWQIKD